MGKSLQPETALNSWRQWRGDLRTRPVILGSLSGGRSNRSFLLDSDGNKMVLRLNGADSFLPDTSRSGEIRIWQAASNQGIAPPLCYVDEDTKYLVSTYIKSSLPPQPQLDETFTGQAFDLLSRCHQLKIEAASIDYASHIRHYWQIIEAKAQSPNQALHKQRKPMRSMLESLIASNTPTGLCHHDPVIANFVGNLNRLYLIDWEYAAHGLQIMDYAALAVEWGLDDTTVLMRTGFAPEQFAMSKSLYRYLCVLWGFCRVR